MFFSLAFVLQRNQSITGLKEPLKNSLQGKAWANKFSYIYRIRFCMTGSHLLEVANGPWH